MVSFDIAPLTRAVLTSARHLGLCSLLIQQSSGENHVLGFVFPSSSLVFPSLSHFPVLWMYVNYGYEREGGQKTAGRRAGGAGSCCVCFVFNSMLVLLFAALYRGVFLCFVCLLET